MKRGCRKMLSGNGWIIVGIIASAIAAFALPYGFHLKGQERKITSTPEIKNYGDFVQGNKTVIKNQVNLNAVAGDPADNKTKIDVSKLKINRAFEDFNKAIDAIVSGFPKESEATATQFNVRGVPRGGGHIQAQMDLSISTKKKLDQKYEELKRKIEDVLVEVLNKPSLQSAGIEFNEELRLLDEAQ